MPESISRRYNTLQSTDAAARLVGVCCHSLKLWYLLERSLYSVSGVILDFKPMVQVEEILCHIHPVEEHIRPQDAKKVDQPIAR